MYNSLFVCYYYRYQLFIDDYMEANVSGFDNEWRLDLFTSTESPRLFLGAGDDKETWPYFKGCMKNFAIQFKSDNFFKFSYRYAIMYITEPLAF